MMLDEPLITPLPKLTQELVAQVVFRAPVPIAIGCYQCGAADVLLYVKSGVARCAPCHFFQKRLAWNEVTATLKIPLRLLSNGR